MTLIYRKKVEKAIELAETLEQIDFIEKKIKTTGQINRRTKEGRELVKELLQISWSKAQELIKKGEQPF